MITFARVVSVPLMVWMILGGYFMAAFWVFMAAGASDAIDGIVAKRFNLETEFGKYLDPLADKALLVSVYLTLGHQELIVSWLVILVVFRDAMIVGGAILFDILTHSLNMRPLFISKANTLAQIVLAAAVIGIEAYDIDDPGLVGVMIYLVGLTTVLSGAAYAITWGRMAVDLEADK
ncbi:MAG: CDP-alcohol phosphatidyltransferase family protein [Rhodospirillales bacterium]